MKKRTVLIALILGVIAVSTVFLLRAVPSGTSESSQPASLKKPPPVRVASATSATISRTLELTGSVEAYRVAQLASPAEGPVLDIRAREGDRVKAGEVLLSIGRKKGIDALIASLREELRKEEENLRGTEELVESEALPGEELDRASTAFEKVRAQLVKAEETALDYAITAPWDGVVSRLIVKDGEFVAPHAALLEMYDPMSLVIRTAVPEKHAVEITASVRVDVMLDAFPGEVLAGRVARVYPYLDPRLRSRAMEIVLERPIDLLPGMFARLKVLVETANDAVVVPIEAVVLTPKGSVVFVVEDGKALARPVETGIEEGDRIQIVEGVHPGEKVIVAGNERLKDGAAVSVAGEGKPGEGKSQRSAETPSEGKMEAGGGQQ